MAAPKGMWECPKCGDYIFDYQKTCPNCSKKQINATDSATTYKPSVPTTYKTYQPSKKPSVAYTIEPSGSALGSSSAGFLRALAIILWILGVILCLFLLFTLQEFKFLATIVVATTYGLLGGFVMCAAELFDNIQAIKNCVQGYNVRKVDD